MLAAKGAIAGFLPGLGKAWLTSLSVFVDAFGGMDTMARSFSRVLNDLGGAEESWESALGEPQLRISAGVGSMVAALGPEKKNGIGRAPRRYEELPEEQQPKPQLSLSDLVSQIGKATSMDELRRLRRQFARLSHPDRCDDSSATSEMAAANRLVDDAIASLRKRRDAQY
jgi:hypothetical protein